MLQLFHGRVRVLTTSRRIFLGPQLEWLIRISMERIISGILWYDSGNSDYSSDDKPIGCRRVILLIDGPGPGSYTRLVSKTYAN
jgi:hypothetical protein